MQLVEKHIIKKGHALWAECDRLCFLSKNLRNAALYQIRQAFFADEGKYLGYNELQKQFQNENQVDYRALPAKVAQQILMQLDKDFCSFFKANQSYRENPNKFLGKPKIPRYKDPEKGRNALRYTIQAISKVELNKGFIKLSQTNIKFPTKIKAKEIGQVRIVPFSNCYKIEVVYEKLERVQSLDNRKYAAIDLGVTNLATVVSNVKAVKPLIINGKPLKSINQFYNKERAKLQAFAELEKQKTSKRLEKLTHQRNCKVDNYLHNASRFITNQIVSQAITKVVIGKNDLWKQEVKMSRQNNQNFVSIPHAEFIKQLKYKLELEGVEVIVQEESYTSKCSFLDNEPLKKQETYCGKRIKRGLFKASSGQLLNADVNGGGNILRKAFPNAFTAEGIEGVVVRPIRVTPYKINAKTHLSMF